MKAVIFDMDGVIIDSEPIHTITKMQTFKHYDIPFAEKDCEKYMGQTTKSLFAALIKQHNRDISVAEMVAHKYKLYLDILENNKSIQPIEGILDLLSYLKQEAIPTAIGSSSGREIIDAVVKKFQLKSYFQSIISGADLPKSKPDPAVYLLTADRLDVLPTDCIVIEDTSSGVQAAKAAGMYCIAHQNKNSGCQDLRQADIIVPSIKSIDLSLYFRN